MFRTTTVTELRSDLSSQIESLADGPLLVLSRSKPAAMIIDPDLFENLIERIELIEDFLDGHQSVVEYIEDPNIAVDAEEVFERLGL